MGDERENGGTGNETAMKPEMSVQAVYKRGSEGNNIPFEMKECCICFADELTLNLPKYERDDDVHLDICRNELGMLMVGGGVKYVAELDIPARQYTEYEDGVDEEGRPVIKKEAVPFCVSNVKLTLWEV